jgi:hypothetical protein
VLLGCNIDVYIIVGITGAEQGCSNDCFKKQRCLQDSVIKEVSITGKVACAVLVDIVLLRTFFYKIKEPPGPLSCN